MAAPIEAQLARVGARLREVEYAIEALLAEQTALQTEQQDLQRRLALEQRAPRAEWSSGEFEWDAEALALLQQRFRLDQFRPLQREAINATLQGRDVLCLLPSGGGKSLCYQLPALLRSGLTLVVSPLLSLIHDQVAGLEALGIRGAALTSLSSKEETAAVMRELDDPAAAGLRLLYCTPERLLQSKRLLGKLEKLYRAGRLERVAIDEAHCCSSYGNDFRPDYRKLAVLKQQFPETPVLALTATATAEVCADIRAVLRIDGCELFRASVNRPNLFYELVPKPAGVEELMDEMALWVAQTYPQGDSGIVYALTRKETESFAEGLRLRGLACEHYHADLEPAARQAVHARWASGRTQIVVATIAFGMGINNTSVRFVLHSSLSKSIENYYQESGRAGRDGAPAHCRLYYRFADYMRHAGVVAMDANWEPCLNGMLRYAAATECRRSVISRHFGEAPAPCRGMCDVCKHGAAPVVEDRTAAAGAVVRTLQEWPGAEKRATLIQLVDKWRARGGEDGKAAKAMSKAENELVIQSCVSEGILRLDFGFTAYATNAYLCAAPKAGALLQQRGWRLLVSRPQPAPGDGQHAGSSGAKQQQQQQQQPKQKKKKPAAEPEVIILDSDSDDDFLTHSKRRKA